VSAVRKTVHDTTVAKHPVRPRAGGPSIAAMHAAIAKRYPKVLAELAK